MARKSDREKSELKKHGIETDSERIRIAFFSASMKPGQDGVTRVLYKITDKLLNRNVEFIFFSAIVPAAKDQPVPMYKVPSMVVPFYRDYRLSVAADIQVNTVLRKFKPDILCVNSPCSLGWAAYYYARHMKLPIVAHYHTHFVSYAGYYKVTLLRDLGWHYMKMFYNNMQRTFVPSQPIVDELSTHGVRNLCLLPHGVDCEMFSRRFHSTAWKQSIGVEGKTVLLYVGRLVWEKDLATLAAAYTLIERQRDDVALVLAGDGPIRKDLQHLLPNAIFLGHKSGGDLAECYASADVFVFPSTTETFGMVTLEAMASGIVPVCANAGGAAGILIHGETGFLAQPRDAEDFARLCLELVINTEKRRRMANAAYQYAQLQSWDTIVDRMLGEYKHVIGDYDRRRAEKRLRKPRREKKKEKVQTGL